MCRGKGRAGMVGREHEGCCESGFESISRQVLSSPLLGWRVFYSRESLDSSQASWDWHLNKTRRAAQATISHSSPPAP